MKDLQGDDRNRCWVIMTGLQVDVGGWEPADFHLCRNNRSHAAGQSTSGDWAAIRVANGFLGGTSDVRCLHPAKDSPGAAGSFLDIEGERTMLTRRKHPRRNVGSPIHSCILLESILVVERMTSKIESHPK